MKEKRVCPYCDQQIDEEESKTLGDDSVVCESCFEEYCRECEVCGKHYFEDNMHTLDDDAESQVCEECYDSSTEECAMCGSRFLEKDMTYWGDVRICPRCLDDQCPSFNEEENEAETREAYEAFCKKYLGKRVSDQKAGTIELDSTVGDEAPICYTISVTVDENGMITAISRLTASMLLSEGITNSNWRPYPIDNGDYDFWAEDLLDENLEFDDFDDEDEEYEEEEE